MQYTSLHNFEPMQSNSIALPFLVEVKYLLSVPVLVVRMPNILQNYPAFAHLDYLSKRVPSGLRLKNYLVYCLRKLISCLVVCIKALRPSSLAQPVFTSSFTLVSAMVFRGQDLWRSHPIFQWRFHQFFVGLKYAVPIFATYLVVDKLVNGSDDHHHHENGHASDNHH